MTYVALAVRSYAEGRVLIHTDRIDGYQMGHGTNSKSFWRNVFNWTSKRFSREIINVGFLSYNNNSGDKISTLEPISMRLMSLTDLATEDLSALDCLYFAGLPENVSEIVASNIEQFVREGGGLILESPDNGNENINVLSQIESVFCYSEQSPMENDAYWTLVGNSHYIFNGVIMPFGVTLRESDFSGEWVILMSDVPSTVTTTTLPPSQYEYNFGNRGDFEFAVAFVSSMQNGIAMLEAGSSSSSSSESIGNTSSSSSSSEEVL